jgi:hypothetical protein
LLDPEIEDMVRAAIKQTSAGSYLALDPDSVQLILHSMRTTIAPTPPGGQPPVLLTAIDVRRFVRKLIEGEFPDLSVVSYQEIVPEIRIQPLGTGLAADMTHPLSPATPVSAQGVRNLQQLAAAESMMAVESQEDFEQYSETSPFVIYQRFLPMAQLKNESKKLEQKQAIEGKQILEVEEAEETAARFQRNNDELKARTLLILRASITKQDTAEEVLNKVL